LQTPNTVPVGNQRHMQMMESAEKA
jgi:hypothetical protein